MVPRQQKKRNSTAVDNSNKSSDPHICAYAPSSTLSKSLEVYRQMAADGLMDSAGLDDDEGSIECENGDTPMAALWKENQELRLELASYRSKFENFADEIEK